MTKVAVVTGSNKGIGLAIVRALCKSFKGDVYLTSRDVKRGAEAVKLLEGEGLSPKYHQVDVTDSASIAKLRDHMTGKYGGIDVLVNNVGIAFKNADTTDFGIQAVVSMKTNYYGTISASDALIPTVKSGGRVVNVSSTVSFMSLKKCSEENKRFFRAEDLTEEALTEKMEDFVAHAKKGTHVAAGYSDSAYGMSKVGMTCLTRIWAKKLRAEGKSDVVINACCPGWVRTDMGGAKGAKSPDEGAITPVYLAMLPAGVNEPHGKFFSDKTVREW